MHRDSIGSAQAIMPGDVNWMTAGRGITHSERTTEARRSKPHVAHGLQTWVALPQEFEQIEPEFHHYQSSVLPEFQIDDVTLKLVAGKAFGPSSL
ncbi:pirin family protein [Candidatus Finniella inopinata]|uniref:pirin family protein n=1 Tax=Candidatus Finniella inopinata TaxID=1696036 RepID=UPI001F5D8136